MLELDIWGNDTRWMKKKVENYSHNKLLARKLFGIYLYNLLFACKFHTIYKPTDFPVSKFQY